MSKYFKIIEGNVVVGIGKNIGVGIEVTEAEYFSLQAAFEERQAKIADYVEKVKAGEITLEEMPEEYMAEVQEIINQPEPEPTYTLDEAAAIIASEVAGDE